MEEDTDIAPILLAGLAGMVLFFAFSFGLVAVVAEPGFGILSMILVAVALVMLLARHIIVRRHREERAKALAKAKCRYCGGQNRPHAIRCFFCGAPLW